MIESLQCKILDKTQFIESDFDRLIRMVSNKRGNTIIYRYDWSRMLVQMKGEYQHGRESSKNY